MLQLIKNCFVVNIALKEYLCFLKDIITSKFQQKKLYSVHCTLVSVHFILGANEVKIIFIKVFTKTVVNIEVASTGPYSKLGFNLILCEALFLILFLVVIKYLRGG
jgi:hypothetical protein